MAAYELKLPDLGEGLTEATIVRWLVSIGDEVARNQVLAELETAKAVVELPSPRGGVILYRDGNAGDSVGVGALLVVIGDQDEIWKPSVPAASHAATRNGRTGSATEPVGIVSGPDIAHAAHPGPRALLAVRKLAKELGVDLAQIRGTGAGGQIVEGDVRMAADKGTSRPLTAFRRSIAQHLTAAWGTPQVTAWSSVPARQFLAAARTEAQPIEALLVRAVIPVLDELPEFSAHFDGERLSHPGRHDIGLAIDTPMGLIVGVLRDAGSQTTAEICANTRRLLTLGREGKLPPSELRGQTFTLSNIGALGGRYGTAIVPLNTTAMLSVGRAADEVVPVDGVVTIQAMLPLGLSFDHRVIDGSAAQRFLDRVCAAIENFESQATPLAAGSELE